MTSKIASAAGIAGGGDSPASKAVATAMRAQLHSAQDDDADPVDIRSRLMAARYLAKPPERR